MEDNYPSTRLRKGYGTVYSLSDDSGNVFYIGCTVRLLKYRLKEHIKAAKDSTSCNSYKNEIIKSNGFDISINEISRHWLTGKSGYMMQKKLSSFENKTIVQFMNKGVILSNDLCKGSRLYN